MHLSSVVNADQIIREWTDGSVVFDRKTGATHAIDRESSIVLSGVVNGMEMLDILVQLGATFPHQDAESTLFSAASRLNGMGLIRMDEN